jgi:hypothetical protein
MNALEVSIDGKRVGVYVPPEGSTFAAMVGNVPRTYMRAHIMTGNDAESWQWQLPEIKADAQNPAMALRFSVEDHRPGLPERNRLAKE